MTHQLLQGDCIKVLKTLAPKSVQCIVTSPPYYNLRDYGTAAWVGGGTEMDINGETLFECEDCKIVLPLSKLTSGCPNCGQTMTPVECNHQYQKGGRNPETSAKQISSAGTTFSQYEKVCKRCGAQRVDAQIGLEETPQQYVDKLVQVFREVRRVLKDDGTVWLNLGDSYNGSGKGGNPESSNHTKQRTNVGSLIDKPTRLQGLKPKDLLGIPWAVAFALRADGWWLRSDIIWHKPNPMPESVTDRPTKSHEYIFLLTKCAQYYYDAEAIMEPASGDSGWEKQRQAGKGWPIGGKNPDASLLRNDIGRANNHKNLQPDGQAPNTMHINRAKGLGEPKGYGLNGDGFKGHSGNYDADGNLLTHEKDGAPARNKRSVWTVSTQPYAGAHFATFPPKLIEPCILAGSRPGDTVLDPFNGSGTTGAVAIKHHRNYTGIDLNPAYIELTRKRFAAVQPVLFGVHNG
jgi:DNA modification methylase